MITSFCELVAPTTPEQFRSECLEGGRHHLARLGLSAFKDGMSWAILESLLSDSARWDSRLKFGFVGCGQGEQWFLPPNHWRYSHGAIDGRAVDRLLRMRHTCVLRDFECCNAHLQNITLALEAEFGTSVFGQLFFSQPNGARFNIHGDLPNIFALQCEGRKVWKLYESLPEERLERGESGLRPKSQNEAVLMDEIELTPGDVLFVPSGMLHEAVTAESSLHISYAVTGVTVPALVRMCLEVWLTNAPDYAWSQAMPKDRHALSQLWTRFGEAILRDGIPTGIDHQLATLAEPRFVVNVDAVLASSTSEPHLKDV